MKKQKTATKKNAKRRTISKGTKRAPGTKPTAPAAPVLPKTSANEQKWQTLVYKANTAAEFLLKCARIAQIAVHVIKEWST